MPRRVWGKPPPVPIWARPCERVLSHVLAPLSAHCDCILIDCGHSIDLLTANALAAADQVIVPVQAHYLAHENMAAALEVIRTMRREKFQRCFHCPY